MDGGVTGLAMERLAEMAPCSQDILSPGAFGRQWRWPVLSLGRGRMITQGQLLDRIAISPFGLALTNI